MPVRVLDRPAVLLGLPAASGEGGREPGHGDRSGSGGRQLWYLFAVLNYDPGLAYMCIGLPYLLGLGFLPVVGEGTL